MGASSVSGAADHEIGKFPRENGTASTAAKPSQRDGGEWSNSAADTSNGIGMPFLTGSQSPTAPMTALDAALGYYDVLSKMRLDSANVTDFFNVGANISAARLRSIQTLKTATTSRIQDLRGRLRPGKYLQLQWNGTPRQVLLRDKASFTLGVLHVIISAFWLGKSPSTFYQLYTIKAVLLFIIRFVTYRREKMHYYLFDFCYYSNILLIIHVWFLPEWCLLERILFAYATGPLAWTIVAFRNSMIFHSIDKMTSVFMHVFPMIVLWTERWYPGDAKHWKTIASKSCERKTASVWELVVLPWIPYAIWAVAYYLKIFVISSKRIQERGYHTLFKYVIRNPRSLMGRVNAMLPRPLAPIVYMLWHVVFCAATFMVAMVCWRHYWVHTVFCCAVVFASVWNGGTYYFDVFAHHYLDDTGLPAKAPKQKGHLPARGAVSAEENCIPDLHIANVLAHARARSESDMSAFRMSLDESGMLDDAVQLTDGELRCSTQQPSDKEE